MQKQNLSGAEAKLGAGKELTSARIGSRSASGSRALPAAIVIAPNFKALQDLKIVCNISPVVQMIIRRSAISFVAELQL